MSQQVAVDPPPTHVPPLLSVDALKVWFRGRGSTVRAVDGVSFEIETGTSLGIVGESGSGKSVTAFAVAGLLQPPAYVPSGAIHLDGTDISAMSERQMRHLRGRTVGMVFQEPMSALNPVMTVGRQISEAIRAHQRVSRREANAKALELLKSVEMPAPERRMKDFPNSLSGGMRQRVVIAMAMANDPALLILDEPTTALDVTVQAQILDLVRGMRAEHGTSVLLISHDIAVVADFCDQIVVMYGGKVMEKGPVSTVLEEPLHPYTIGLIASIPSGALKGQRLSTISGSVPSPEDMPTGCPFSSRCPHVFDKCLVQPPMVRLGDGRDVACWLYGGDA